MNRITPAQRPRRASEPGHSRPGAAAFTLLEMILAMAMVAMLSGALYMSLTIAFKARESAQANIAPVRTATIAMDLLRQDLESVPAPGPAEDTAALAGPFVGGLQIGQGQSAGTMSSLSFCTVGRDLIAAPAAAQGQVGGLAYDQPLSEGIRRVELGVRTDLSPPALVRRVWRNLLAQVEEEPQEEILCRGVRSFTVSFYDGITWQPEWDSTLLGDTLPLAVEINLEIDRNPAQPQQSPLLTADAAQTYRITRVFPLACAKPFDPLQSDLGGIQ